MLVSSVSRPPGDHEASGQPSLHSESDWASGHPWQRWWSAAGHAGQSGPSGALSAGPPNSAVACQLLSWPQPPSPCHLAAIASAACKCTRAQLKHVILPYCRGGYPNCLLLPRMHRNQWCICGPVTTSISCSICQLSSPLTCSMHSRGRALMLDTPETCSSEGQMKHGNV